MIVLAASVGVQPGQCAAGEMVPLAGAVPGLGEAPRAAAPAGTAGAREWLHAAVLRPGG